MTTDIVKNIWRFILFVLLQVLVFKHLSPDNSIFSYVSFIIYPLFLMLLPFRTPVITTLFLGLLVGLSVDWFYDSWGVHASASVFTAYARSIVLSIYEPRGGYNLNQMPSKAHLGINWFLYYSGTLMLLHLAFYFSVEAFTFIYLGQIILKTALSFIFSMIFVVIYMFVFDPEE